MERKIKDGFGMIIDEAKARYPKRKDGELPHYAFDASLAEQKFQLPAPGQISPNICSYSVLNVLYLSLNLCKGLSNG